MSWFLGGIVVLVIGYFTYGRIVERIVGPDDRKTPCVANPDGVDFVPLPLWKNMLIQLLNIAGVGPVIGVILGIKFGKVALLIIPVGCIFMGAVHDYLVGMMSMRMNGANMPRMVREEFGVGFARGFTWFVMILLLLVVAVFVNVPANLIDRQWFPEIPFFWWAAVLVFIYYIMATLFPVDKIIGRIYPIFGALLIIGSLAIFFALVVVGFRSPEIFNDCAGFADYKASNPLFPCLFVTIACGIISGFHATQSPIVARTCVSEHQARLTFYGMMILEGVIAMIWAAAALAIYNINSENLGSSGPIVLGNIANHFLGRWMGGVTVAAIIILAITSGDTALRSSRLTFAEELHIDQKNVLRRILTTLPFIFCIAGLLWWSNASAKTFGLLWNYFAWGNQVIAVVMLMTTSVWLLRQGRGVKSVVTLLPGVFMCTVVMSFILWASPEKGQVWGAGLPYGISLIIGGLFSLAVAAFVIWRGRNAAQ